MKRIPETFSPDDENEDDDEDERATMHSSGLWSFSRCRGNPSSQPSPRKRGEGEETAHILSLL